MRDVQVVERRARARVPRQPAVLCQGRGRWRALHGLEQFHKVTRDAMLTMGEVGETMTKETTKPKAAKKPAKGKSAKLLPVKAWEKLKGRGPFPSVALDEELKKQLETT